MSIILAARRRRTAGGGAFSPSDISGLQEWFAADAIVGLSDGDPVSTWADASGNARDATAAGAVRPTYQTNEQNSLPIVRFASASNQRMAFTAHTGFTAISIFAVVKRSGTAADHVVLSCGKTLIRIDVAGNNLEWFPDTDSTVIDSNHDINDANWHTISVLQSGTGVDIRLDGVSDTRTTVAVDATNVTDGIGGYEGGALWNFNGDIAEIIVYDSDLSDGDRDSVEGYLSGKWNL
jgi:hypothetical protein